jgi:DNA replication initiation complex subunit (GINS family)
MKLFNLFMVGALALTMLACKSSGKDALVGTWGVESVDMSAMLAGMSEEEKKMYESFLPMMEEAMKSMVMTFKADGKMETKASMMGQENTDKGTWKLSEDGKTLTTETGGKKEDIKIESLDDSKMVLVMNLDGSSMKMTMKKKK